MKPGLFSKLNPSKEQYIKFDCSSCFFNHFAGHARPCRDCYDYSEWEPDMDRLKVYSKEEIR